MSDTAGATDTDTTRFASASDIKVGVIGYGGAFNMGRAHLKLMKEAGMTPHAVAEIDPERLKVATEEFPGIQTFTSVDEMLEKSGVNLVVIITPHNTHAPLALQCLKAGRHVVCEKPMAVTTEECDEMIEEAKKQNLVITTYHNRHWDGCIMQGVKKIIEEGAIGEIRRIEAHRGNYGKPKDWWRSSKSISGGIMYDWGVHILEYALQLIRSDIVEVMGFASSGHWSKVSKWGEDTNEDEAQAVVRFANGVWMSLRQSAIDPVAPGGMLRITGTEGTYIMEGKNWKIVKKVEGEDVTEEGENPQSEYRHYYQNVADHLVKDTELIISPEWSRRPIHILDLADKSAKAGKTLQATYK
jgi:predicted dehydrogenase